MPQEPNQDVISIKEWMTKESYLPNDFDDHVIKKFLHSCDWSLEKTKKCIECFCVTRRQMSNEIYSSRDPSAPNLQTMFSITVVSNYQFGNEEFIIHKYDDPTIDKFSFFDVLRTLTMQADHWIQKKKFIADGHYVIIDMSYYSLKMVPKVNIMFFRDFLIYLLEGMPVRLKKVIAINAPSYYDKLYALIKPALPADVCNMISFHSDYESLYQFIDKKYLPTEYGGEAQSMYEKSKNWVKILQEDRLFFSNDDLWKADLTKKLKKDNVGKIMKGSFKKLCID